MFVAGIVHDRSATTRRTTPPATTSPTWPSFNIDTGLVDTAFRPTFGGGGVTEIELSPDGTKLFVVGRFNTVNGVTKRKSRVDQPDHGRDGHRLHGQHQRPRHLGRGVQHHGLRRWPVHDHQRCPAQRLAAVSATTGANVTGFLNNLTGGIGVNGALTVQAMVLTHDGTKLLVVHTGRQVAGQDRYAAALINTQTNQLLPWRTRLWDDNLQFVGGITRVYAADIAPNDQYFVVSSGSGGDRPPISDTAVAYPIDGGDNVEPLWISRAFDSIYSVADHRAGRLHRRPLQLHRVTHRARSVARADRRRLRPWPGPRRLRPR